MCKIEEENYIRISLSNYCLARLFLSLRCSGIDEYAITQEDDGLVLRISVSYLESLIYDNLSEESTGKACL
jgi:hypothetical protein